MDPNEAYNFTSSSKSTLLRAACYAATEQTPQVVNRNGELENFDSSKEEQTNIGITTCFEKMSTYSVSYSPKALSNVISALCRMFSCNNSFPDWALEELGAFTKDYVKRFEQDLKIHNFKLCSPLEYASKFSGPK